MLKSQHSPILLIVPDDDNDHSCSHSHVHDTTAATMINHDGGSIELNSHFNGARVGGDDETGGDNEMGALKGGQANCHDELHDEDDNDNHGDGSNGGDPSMQHQNPHTSHLLRWVPGCFRFDNAPSEATGLSLDNYARGHVMMSSMFLGPALLVLAQQAARDQCMGDDDKDVYAGDAGSIETLQEADQVTLQLQEDEQDEGDLPLDCRIYGFRPSSLLANIAVVAGLLSATAMPFVGAVVDHTPYRRHVASISAIVLAIVKLAEVMVAPATWFVVALLQILSHVLYNVHATAAFAYTSELTSDPGKQSQYNSFYTVCQYISMLVFLVLILGLSAILGVADDDVQTARISQVVTGTVSLLCFVVAWRYFFRDRPASSHVPPDASLWTCGFRKVWQTSRRIVTQYRALSWSILAIMFAESSISALTSIATTFLKEQLEMTADEIALVFLIVLITGIPGSHLGAYLSVRFNNPILSALLCDALLIVTTVAAAFLATDPNHKMGAYICSIFWGIGMGWLSPVDTTIFMNLMPTDSRAEFMGFFMLAAIFLSWLPSLVFSSLNEAGFSLAGGLMSLNLFLVAAMACLYQVGDYNQARMEAASAGEMEKRQEQQIAPTMNDNGEHDRT